METYKTVHRPAEHRFEIWEDGAVSYVEYYIHDGYLDILHTIVPMHMENRGLGSALVKSAFDWAKGEGLTPKGTCWFAHQWLERHPDYKE